MSWLIISIFISNILYRIHWFLSDIIVYWVFRLRYIGNFGFGFFRFRVYWLFNLRNGFFFLRIGRLFYIGNGFFFFRIGRLFYIGNGFFFFRVWFFNIRNFGFFYFRVWLFSNRLSRIWFLSNFRLFSIVITLRGRMPPLVEFTVPGFVEFHEAVILVIIGFIEGFVHEVVEFITAVEVTTSFTRAVGKGSDFACV